jgi:hypothetical protein
LRDSEKLAPGSREPSGGLLPIAGAPQTDSPPPEPGARTPRALREGERLAAVIRAYWQARGYAVATDIGSVSQRSEGKAPVSAVRSDLVAGMPVGMAGRWRRPPPTPAPRGRRP